MELGDSTAAKRKNMNWRLTLTGGKQHTPALGARSSATKENKYPLTHYFNEYLPLQIEISAGKGHRSKMFYDAHPTLSTALETKHAADPNDSPR